MSQVFTTFKDISKPLFQHNFKTILYLGANHYIKSSFKADLMFIITLRPHTLVTVQLRNYKSITHQEFSVNSGPSAHGCASECVCPFNVRLRKCLSFFFYVFALSASLLCLKVFLPCVLCVWIGRSVYSVHKHTWLESVRVSGQTPPCHHQKK